MGLIRIRVQSGLLDHQVPSVYSPSFLLESSLSNASVSGV